MKEKFSQYVVRISSFLQARQVIHSSILLDTVHNIIIQFSATHNLQVYTAVQW